MESVFIETTTVTTCPNSHYRADLTEFQLSIGREEKRKKRERERVSSIMLERRSEWCWEGRVNGRRQEKKGE